MCVCVCDAWMLRGGRGKGRGGGEHCCGRSRRGFVGESPVCTDTIQIIHQLLIWWYLMKLTNYLFRIKIFRFTDLESKIPVCGKWHFHTTNNATSNMRDDTDFSAARWPVAQCARRTCARFDRSVCARSTYATFDRSLRARRSCATFDRSLCARSSCATRADITAPVRRLTNRSVLSAPALLLRARHEPEDTRSRARCTEIARYTMRSDRPVVYVCVFQ